jgi:hypothetical protein
VREAEVRISGSVFDGRGVNDESIALDFHLSCSLDDHGSFGVGETE